MTHSNCTDLGEVFVDLGESDECCPDCIDCRSGCCPIWLKMATIVFNRAAPQPNSPTGGLECWDYFNVVEAVEQAWVDPTNSNIVWYGTHVFNGYRDGYNTDMTVSCNAGIVMNFGVTVQRYSNFGLVNTQTYNSGGIHNPPGATCMQWQCHNPIWLGGFWNSVPSLVYQGPNKLHWVDPTQGIPVGADPDCCNNAGFNESPCQPVYAATEATWGAYKASTLLSNVGAFNPSGQCYFAFLTVTSDPRVIGDIIPVGTQLFPGFDPVADYTLCNTTPDPLRFFPRVTLSAEYRCDGTVFALVNQEDTLGCNNTTTPPGCGTACFFNRFQRGSITSSPGQTLPYSVRIPTTKTTITVGPFGTTTVTVPGPGVEFTLDWLP